MSLSSVADPDPRSGAFLTPGSAMCKKSRSGSGMNILDHISEGLEKFFWVKILKILVVDPDPGIVLTPGSGMEKFGSGINIPDSQHCRLGRRKHAVPWIDWGNRKRRWGKVVEAMKYLHK